MAVNSKGRTVAHSGFSLVWRRRNQLLAGYNLLFLVYKTVGSSNLDAFSMFYKSLVCLVLEYAAPVCNPYMSEDKLALERVW